jgi:nitrogen regulatory protein PII 1
MKMVQAVLRPDKEEPVAAALALANFPALTKWDVVGRGRQQGIQVGSHVYDELAKSMLMLVVEDDDVPQVAEIINKVANSGYPGDGKIFVADVETAYTIRTGKAEL